MIYGNEQLMSGMKKSLSLELKYCGRFLEIALADFADQWKGTELLKRTWILAVKGTPRPGPGPRS